MLCESCQYIPSSEDVQDSLEIRSCDHTIFPLSDRMAKNLNRLLVVNNNFSFNIRINAILNLVQKLQYLEFRDNSLIAFSKSKIEKLSNLVELRIKEKKLDLWLFYLPQNKSLAILEVEVKSILAKG